MQQYPSSLEEVKSHFDQWRATRTKREKIPASLWDKVKLLIRCYSLTSITKALRINSNQMKENLDMDAAINFVEANIDAAPLPPNQIPRLSIGHVQTCSIELHRANGSILKICALPTASLPAIITQFIG
jgi:hypothetical protein